MHLEHEHDCGHTHDHPHTHEPEHAHDHSHTAAPRDELIALMRYRSVTMFRTPTNSKSWHISSPIPATAKPARKYSTQSRITKPAIRNSQQVWISFRNERLPLNLLVLPTLDYPMLEKPTLDNPTQ